MRFLILAIYATSLIVTGGGTILWMKKHKFRRTSTFILALCLGYGSLTAGIISALKILFNRW